MLFRNAFITTLFLLVPWFLFASTDPVEATLELVNGDRIHGKITKHDEKTTTVEHPVLGTLVLENKKISAILTASEEPMSEERLPVEPEDLGLFGTGMLTGWDRKFDFGLNGAKGVSDNANLRAGFTTRYLDDSDRWQFDMVYLYTESEQVTSQNRFYANLDKDWLVDESNWYYFANARLDWDEFKDWNYRISLFGGPGYIFHKDDTWYFLGRGGLGGNRTFGGIDDQWTLEALLGIETGWHISKVQFIELKSTFYPAISDPGQYRNITTLDWIHELDLYEGLAVKLGIYNEYDSNQTSANRNDFRYHASLVWGL